MATVKLQNGKVVLKNGKVSCECCGPSECGGPISGEGVFEISKDEYDKIFNGGTWNISFSGSIVENATSTANLPPAGRSAEAQVIGSGNVSFSSEKACSFASSGSIGSGIYSGSFGSFSFSAQINGIHSFSYELGVSNINNNKKYFVKYSLFIEMYYIFFTTLCEGISYPNPPASIEGSKLDGCNSLSSGNFGPYLNDPIYFNGYSRSTSISISINLS